MVKTIFSKPIKKKRTNQNITQVELGEGIYKQGITQGIAQGVDSATIQHILNLMNSFNMSIDQVMDGMKLSDEDKIKYKTIILNQEK